MDKGIITILCFKSLPASVDFCCRLITFANILDPDQDHQNIGPDRHPACLTLKKKLKIFNFFLKKSAATTKMHENYPACKKV